MNNSSYLVLAIRARWEFVTDQGLATFVLQQRLKIVITQNTLKYEKPIFLLDKISIQTSVKDIQNKKITLCHQFYKKNTLVSTCLSECLVLNLPKGRDVLTHYQRYLDGKE